MARTSAASAAQRLAALKHRYRQLATHLADVGYIRSGSIALRGNRCGKTNCRCHADPPQLHGPYWQWTTKIDGKTVNRRLTATQAELYRQWIDNDRRLHDLITQMRAVAADATDLIMKQADHTDTKV